MPRSTTRRARGATLLLAGALTLSACGGDSADRASRTSPSAEDTSTATSPAVEPAIAAPEVGEPQIDGSAEDAFGLDGAEAAFEAAVEFASATTFKEDLLYNLELGAEDFEFVTEYLTPSAAGAFRADVNATGNGDREAYGRMRVLLLFGQHDEGITQHADGSPLVVNHRIDNIVVWAPTDTDGLSVAFDQTAELRMLQNGEAVRVPMHKSITYRLMQAPAGSGHLWLIDGAQGEVLPGAPVPDGQR
jgi:hypothetical protein